MTKGNPNPTIKYTQIFINNEFVNSVSGKTFPTINPCTEKKIVDVAEGDKADVEIAIKAAKVAFARNSEWRKLDASARGRLLYKLSNLIERDLAEFASLESLDNGKTFKNATGDIMGTIGIIRYYAGFADKIHGNTIPSDGPLLSMTRKEPIGVVGVISPWNFPMLLYAQKCAAALACGCTVILKPAEQTPLTALAFAALVKEAGFPKGVFNVVPGYGPTAGATLTESHDVAMVSFTGSTEVGHKIMEAAAKSNLKRVGLELGGKSPLVIFDDVNVDEAAKLAHEAVYVNHGQTCCAGTRTFVQAGIYDAFVKKATELAKNRKVGDPFAEDTIQGPQVDKQMFEKVLRLIECGKKEGATCTVGGGRLGNMGYFIQPTVFSEVTDNMTIAKEEIFGPVQSIIKFNTIEEVIERANNTTYGLASGCMTNDLNRALTFAQAAEAGSVWVNCFNAVTAQTPFGGYKQSGIGRELGAEGLEEYLETKTITIRVPTKH